MKFISVLFMAVVPLSLFASNDEIDVKHKNGTYIETRSIENLPDATIENQILTVSFDKSPSTMSVYILYILKTIPEPLFTLRPCLLMAWSTIMTYPA